MSDRLCRFKTGCQRAVLYGVLAGHGRGQPRFEDVLLYLCRVRKPAAAVRHIFRALTSPEADLALCIHELLCQVLLV